MLFTIAMTIRVLAFHGLKIPFANIYYGIINILNIKYKMHKEQWKYMINFHLVDHSSKKLQG